MGKYKTFGSRFDRVHRNDLNANFAAVEADINAQKNRVDGLIQGTPQPSEVVDARGGFPVLSGRLNDLSSSLAQKATKEEVQAVASGSPKGTYATLSALQTAFPTGNTNIYLVTADGKWYYWNGSAWVIGGVYQSSGIADGTVKLDSLNIATSNRFKGVNVMTEYTVEMGVIGETGTLNAVNYGVRSAEYIKVFKGTRIRLTDYINYNLRVARYSLSDKTFLGAVVNLTKDYYVIEDCFVKITVTNNPTTTPVTDMTTLSNKCYIEHKFINLTSSKFNFANEIITINYDANGKASSIIKTNANESMTSTFSYTGDNVSNITETNGSLTTTTNFTYVNNKLTQISKTGGV
jgi:hypothetical protein